jgi:hypothetical protein
VGWTVWGSNHGVVRISAPVLTSPVTQQTSSTMGIGVCSLRLKRPRRGVNHPSPFNSKPKEEYSCTRILPLDLHGLYYGETYHLPFNKSLFPYTSLKDWLLLCTRTLLCVRQELNFHVQFR